MTEQKNMQSSGNGCVMGSLILIVVVFALVLGAFGGIVAEREGFARTTTTIHPNIPAPEPAQLNYVPSVQTFAEPLNDCPDPSLPYAGWEDGVGGVLPPCWTREQQNAYMRSH